MPKDDLSDEDKALFRQAMRLVEPLKNTPLAELSDHPKPKPVIKKQPHQTIQPTIHLSSYIREPLSGNAILSFFKDGLSEKQRKALKQGKIRWEAKLDLHGKTSKIAEQAVIHFIQHHIEKGSRCLLIIHGKGEKDNTPPVIKNYVNIWLPQFPEIIAFHSAIPVDGGAGAVYVLLQAKRRNS